MDTLDSMCGCSGKRNELTIKIARQGNGSVLQRSECNEDGKGQGINVCFLVTPINHFLIIFGRCTLYTPVCLQDEPRTYVGIFNLHLQLTSRSEGRRTVSCHSCKGHEEKRVRPNKFSSPPAGIEPVTSSTRSHCTNHLATSLPNGEIHGLKWMYDGFYGVGISK